MDIEHGNFARLLLLGIAMPGIRERYDHSPKPRAIRPAVRLACLVASRGGKMFDYLDAMTTPKL